MNLVAEYELLVYGNASFFFFLIQSLPKHTEIFQSRIYKAVYFNEIVLTS